MQVYDSHVHLADVRFAQRRTAVLLSARAVGVEAMLAVSACARDWLILLRLVRRTPGMGIALGLHPWFAHAPEALSRLPVWLRATQACAVGECGLDFAAQRAPRAAQEALLLPQLRLARELDLPVVLHAHKSEDVLAKHVAGFPGLRGVVHGFHGSQQQAERFLQLGLHLGIGGAITHPRAERLRKVVAALPLNRLLLESDAPDQAPFGRSAPNEPAYVLDTLHVLATLHHCPMEDVARQTWQNAASLFRAEAVNV